ncbi:hypothetical protein L9F63_026775, partial [Diploptera punctata]
ICLLHYYLLICVCTPMIVEDIVMIAFYEHVLSFNFDIVLCLLEYWGIFNVFIGPGCVSCIFELVLTVIRICLIILLWKESCNQVRCGNVDLLLITTILLCQLRFSLNCGGHL